MSLLKHSEDSSLFHDVLRILEKDFGYPGMGDKKSVRIKDIPTYNAQGKVNGKMDVVYYHEGIPLLLVEAKQKYKTHEKAKEQAVFYLKNFPKHKQEFSIDSSIPKFIASTVGDDIVFYKWEIDLRNADFILSEKQILIYNKLLKHYGLNKGYKSRILLPSEFKQDFFDELIEVFRKRGGMISKDTIEKIVHLLYNYLEFSDAFTQHYPFRKLSTQQKIRVNNLIERFDIHKSLSPELAKEFRKCVIRAFQGEEFNQYLTDQSIIEFMCALIGKQKSSAKIFDFECGSGGFLAEALNRWKLSMKSIKGIDIDELPYLISKTYLAIYFKKKGKSVDAIPVTKDNGLFNYGNKYDLIIGNPAGSNEYKHGNEKRIIDDGLKNLTGNNSFKEYDLSVQQSLRSCKHEGKICLILPDGFFSNSRDKYLRNIVSENCKVKAIVSLPQGVFKRGRDSKIKGKGASTANMKMSILYCEKYPKSKKKTSNSYPVFLASINEPSNAKGEISDWIISPLNFIEEQFHYWQKNKKLKKKIFSDSKIGLKNKL